LLECSISIGKFAKVRHVHQSGSRFKATLIDTTTKNETEMLPESVANVPMLILCLDEGR
jgi:hypothetical protein